MRKLHLILILSLSFVAGADLTAQNRGHRHDKMEYCHDERMRHADKEKNHRRHHRQTYFVDSKGVYFNGRPTKMLHLQVLRYSTAIMQRIRGTCTGAERKFKGRQAIHSV